ncbi:MAG: CotH kinase family protein, partial [Chthoniobacteraceae bacterium]
EAVRRGSERGRNQPLRVSFNVEFPANQRFLGAHNTISMDRSGAGNQFSQKEILIKHGINHAGGIPGSEDDLCRIIAPMTTHTGPAILVKQRFDSTYLDNQYDHGAEGRQFKYELIYYPTSTNNGSPEGLKIPEPDSVVGVDLKNLGSTKEFYRWHWLIENNADADDYSGLMTFLTAFGRPVSAQYFADTAAMMEVDEWLRAWAIQILYGVGDNYSSGAQHNFLIYQRPEDGRWLNFPHDMDFTFTQGATSTLTPNGDLNKLIANPANRRAYYAQILELCTTTYNSAYLGPWAQHYTRFVNENLTSFMSYVEQRRTFALNTINSAIPPVPFDITTADGSSPDSQVTIEGRAWLDVHQMRLAGSTVPLAVTWSNPTTWSAPIAIAPGPNVITIEAYGVQGNLIASDVVTITGTGTIVPADATNLVISEIMYHPANPSPEEITAGFSNQDEFEFLELQNISATNTISLAGLQFTTGIAINLPDVMLAPGARGIIVRNQAAFTQRYGAGINILGVSDPGKVLSDNGDQLTLLTQGGATVRSFSYDDKAPWPSSPDGDGFSLVLVNPASNPNHALPENWRASVAPGGNPGASDATTFTGDPNADANDNGVSDLTDYALAGTTPFQPPTTANSDGYLTITYRRNLAADDVTLTVQRSIDFAGWASGDNVKLIAESHNGDGTSTYVWRSTHPATESQREFLRVQITKP